ncbi:hypothetical protein MMC07_003456 [Pseudocyphellaria aurata]|nr:hypothetical protein [Pseudocyphellaria aurata]
MRSSTTLFQAVLLALATASPRPEIPHIGTAAVSHAEPRSLVARADDLSPELAQLVADNGITSTCYSSTEPPIVLTAKKAKRQEDLVPRQEGLVAEACSYPNPDISNTHRWGSLSPVACSSRMVQPVLLKTQSVA